MPTPITHRRRGRQRRIRLVVPDGQPRLRPSPIDPSDADGWDVGLLAARIFQELFPEVFADLVAPQTCTPGRLYQAACAFLSLVDERLFSIQDPSMLSLPTDPIAYLQKRPPCEGEAALGSLEEGRFSVLQPWPLAYGLGVQSVMNNYEEMGETAYSALTLGLWQLFSQTSLAVGYAIEDLADDLTPAATAAVLALCPLPPTDVASLLRGLSLPGRPYGADVGTLIWYAFGQTGNLLADYTDWELGEMFDHNDMDWVDAAEIAEQARQARELSGAYGMWERAVTIDPSRELAYLANLLHARAAGAPLDGPRTLAELFEDSHHDDAIEDNKGLLTRDPRAPAPVGRAAAAAVAA